MEFIKVSPDGSHFIYGTTGHKFVVWGVNYDHDDLGNLIEDYWDNDWAAVVKDFNGIKQLGANVVRVHIQFAKFMVSPGKPNEHSLKQLVRLANLAQSLGLRLDITGLGCYHKQDVPDWYTRMDAPARWDEQAIFWRAVSKACANSPAIFDYDLANEPIVPGPNSKNTEWLTGHLGDMYFDQLLTLDIGGQTQEQVAAAWTAKMVNAIRENDSRHMTTIGINPLHFDFHGGKDVFASKAVNSHLDYVSIHIYPEHKKVDWAVKSIAYYKIPGKPIINEEMFPLSCNVMDIDSFINNSRNILSGYIGFYWGTRPAPGPNKIMGNDYINKWLEYYRSKGPEIKSHVTQ
jgi:endo-1,4-beta-mannosidase